MCGGGLSRLHREHRAKKQNKFFKKNSSRACETVEKSASVEKLLKGPPGSFQ